MASKGGKGDISESQKCCFGICNKANLINIYSPAVGAASYSMLSVNVLNPTLNLSFMSKRDVTNLLLAGTLVGTGCYLYTRPHLQAATNQNRIIYAGFGSVMFTFSSVLLWAVLRSFLPNNVAIGSAAGLATSYALIKGGQSYLALIDSQVTKK